MVWVLGVIAVLLLCLVVVVARGLSALPAAGRAVAKLIDSREIDGDDDFERYYAPGLVQLREQVKRLTAERDALAAQVADHKKQPVHNGARV